MEQGPLPPHERTWRHPSELAAEERAAARAETTAPSTRAFALTTGTIGLLAVGFLILTVTPRSQESPVAISATTNPAAGSQQSAQPSVADTVRPAALAARGPVTTQSVEMPPALATPIGDGRMAVITSAAMAGHNARQIQVRLPSGRLGTGRAVQQAGDAWLIELHEAETGHRIARDRPKASEIVTVMASPPLTIAFAELDTVDIDEGTPVLDRNGDLVGICGHRRGDGRVQLIEISSKHAGATSGGR